MMESSHKGWDFLPNQANARRERNDAGKPLRIAGKSPMSKERKVGLCTCGTLRYARSYWIGRFSELKSELQSLKQAW